MVAPIKFLSGRQQQQKIGVLDSTENIKVLEVVGRAGIGTTIFEPTKQLDVRGDVFVSGELTVGDTTFGEDFSITDLTVSGVSTFTGISTFANNIIANSGLTVEGISTLNNNVNVQGILDVTGHTELDNLNVAGLSTLTGNVSFGSSAFFGDDDKINMGDGDDLQIYHDGVTGNIHNDTGTLILQSGNVRIQDAGSSETAFSAADGVAKLYFENSEKLTTNARGIDVTGHTETDTLNVSGVSTFQSNVHLGDDDKINLGDNDDFQIFHHSNGTGIIQNAGSGQLQLRSDEIRLLNQATDEDYAFFRNDGAVELYYDNSKKFETTGIGISVLNGTDDTATITGPSNLIIDPMPVGVGTTSGVVRIKGDLFVDGTQTQINSTTIELADFIVGIATTATTDLLADGAGIGIATNKFFTFDNTNTAFKSTENLNLETGHTYKINGTDVLSSDTLGSEVVNSSLTNLGTLDGLNVNGDSQFTSIEVSSNSTFNALVDINNGAEISTLKVEDLTENRVAIAGTGGELEDDANFTFDGSQLALGVGLTVTGLSTFSSNVDINAGLDVSGITTLGVTTATNLTSQQLNVSGITTLGVTTATNLTSQQLNVSGISTLGVTTATNLTSQQLNVSGLSTFSSNVDIDAGLDVDGLSDLDELNVTGLSTFGSNVDINAGLDVDGLSDLDELNVTGLSTFSSNVDINAGLDVSGISTLGVTTATDLTSQQLNVSGISTLGVTTATDLTSQQLNVSGISTLGTVKISSGIVTATSGVVTYYGDGTNLTLTNSVALSDDTTGDYVESISGTANQIEVTGGTGEGSTPVISIPTNPTLPGTTVTIQNDLQVNRNLNVTGNITVGGTSGTLFTETLKVADADLILGVRTDANGVDISTDTTASHGGIAIASTEGTPLITLVNPGAGETLPATYKKIMWFEQGAFAGLGTDAWLINYGVGIGSTQVPDNVVLAAGDVHITNNDIKKVRDINASGITTTVDLKVTGVVTSTKYVVEGGSSTGFLKANGDIDTTVYGTGNGNLNSIEIKDDGQNVGTASTFISLDFYNGIGVSTTSTVGVASIRLDDNISISGIMTAQDFNSTSDENLKININTIEDPLAKVVQIRGVNFEWKENNKPSAGVVAQEVERVLPHLVSKGDPKTVNYNGLIGLLIETVKQQQKQIDNLNTRLSKLE